MKFRIAATCIFLFWLTVFLCGLWVFKILLQASVVPEFATGLVGGVVYAIVMRELASVVRNSFKDFVSEWRARSIR